MGSIPIPSSNLYCFSLSRSEGLLSTTTSGIFRFHWLLLRLRVVGDGKLFYGRLDTDLSFMRQGWVS